MQGNRPKTHTIHQCRHGTRPHWTHHHNQPGYPHKTQAHRRRAALRLPRSVIVITPPRASDSDFTSDFPNRASQTAPAPMSAHAISWPHVPRTDNSDSDDELHKRIMLVLRRPGTLQTTGGRSSSPQIHHRNSDSIATQRSRRTHRTRREEPTNKSHIRCVAAESELRCICGDDDQPPVVCRVLGRRKTSIFPL